ncbi:MAG: hypothetical protein BGO76_03500 [Caedibacter sp. 38-128]|nr:hypothetical protein [Holosporales bacterium]OJX07931.1 MAG: hypothetical protein BGO76_03500 [Caedibacter sp. 38-128]
MVNTDFQELKVLNMQEHDSPQESYNVPQPQSSCPIDDNKSSNNQKPLENEELQDPRKQTPILEKVPNPDINNNPGDKWHKNHPIRPVQV